MNRFECHKLQLQADMMVSTVPCKSAGTARTQEERLSLLCETSLSSLPIIIFALNHRPKGSIVCFVAASSITTVTAGSSNCSHSRKFWDVWKMLLHRTEKSPDGQL